MKRAAETIMLAGAILVAGAIGATPAGAQVAAAPAIEDASRSQPPTESNGTSGEALGLAGVAVFFAVATIRRLRRAA